MAYKENKSDAMHSARAAQGSQVQEVGQIFTFRWTRNSNHIEKKSPGLLLCPFAEGLRFPQPTTHNDSDSANDTTPTTNPSQPASRVFSRPTGTIPREVLETLPSFIDHKVEGLKDRSGQVLPINDAASFRTYLTQELNFARLNAIHSHLWACGRPLKARALHRHLMIGRRIVITEQADLHLLTNDDIIMLKPLPTYMLSREVWISYICTDDGLHKAACGMLLSYIWLIRSVNDFKLAQAESRRLIPEGLTFPEWRRITMESLEYIDADTLHQVNRRFQFGELRLGRINKIYRLDPRFLLQNFVRGYLYQYNRYGPFLQRNVSWILGVSVLFSLGLSAMQVGTGVSGLRDDDRFNQASYGFVVFVCVLVMAILAFVLVICAVVYIYNMIAAIHHSAVEQSRREKLAKLKGVERIETTNTSSMAKDNDIV